ncbi:MAG: 16S rRNA (uracil(1498)-N(3))-methyltransferase [Lachnospiraceae bacterium]|nr:16S rRNA (uracil(1498)-N(3))-methyltransferase [Lachnospiraceae bacterium]
MYRFYIQENQVDTEEIVITGGDVNHIRNVLRLEPGDWVVACDGAGRDYVSRIRELEVDQIVLQVEKVQDTGTELPVRITLFQGLPKKDKMEWIIQKAVELGVYEIVPVRMKRCVVRLEEEKKIRKKQERWQAIAEAAAKQCDRGMVPVVHAPVTMEQAFDIAEGIEYNMIPYELQDGMETSREIVAEACCHGTVGIFIGPEGGFEAEEVSQAVARQMHPLSLGKRILRTETAGMALLSILMFQLQE